MLKQIQNCRQPFFAGCKRFRMSRPIGKQTVQIQSRNRLSYSTGPSPRLIYLQNPLSWLSNKMRLKWLKYTWDREFREDEFMRGVKQVCAHIQTESSIIDFNTDFLNLNGFLYAFWYRPPLCWTITCAPISSTKSNASQRPSVSRKSPKICRSLATIHASRWCNSGRTTFGVRFQCACTFSNRRRKSDTSSSTCFWSVYDVPKTWPTRNGPPSGGICSCMIRLSICPNGVRNGSASCAAALMVRRQRRPAAIRSYLPRCMCAFTRCTVPIGSRSRSGTLRTTRSPRSMCWRCDVWCCWDNMFLCVVNFQVFYFVHWN